MGTTNKVVRADHGFKTIEEFKSIDDAYDTYAPRNGVEREVVTVCNDFARLLIDKNRAYGNSALEPNRIFAKSDSVEQLRVRIDDKLNRIMKGSDFPGEDTVDDLVGYLLLLKIALRDKWR